MPNIPVIIWISGECGSGKTTLAISLSSRLGIPFIDNDDLKQPLLQRGISRHVTGACVYEAILALADSNVKMGHDLIIVAPVCCLDTLSRIDALRTRAKVVLISLEVPAATLDDRITRRSTAIAQHVVAVRSASERRSSFTHKNMLNVSWAMRLDSGTLSVQQMTDAVCALLSHGPPSSRRASVVGLGAVMQLDEVMRGCEAEVVGRLVIGTGVFDLLHPGHMLYLSECRARGDAVYVHLATDEAVCARKGPGRPVLDLNSRAIMLLGTRFVDKVFTSDLHTVDCAQRIGANVVVVSSEYEYEFSARRKQTNYAGDLVLFPRCEDNTYSTTAIARRAAERVTRLPP